MQNQEPNYHLKPPRQGHSNKKSDSNKGSRERLLVAGKSTKISSKDDDELDAFLLGDISQAHSSKAKLEIKKARPVGRLISNPIEIKSPNILLSILDGN